MENEPKKRGRRKIETSEKKKPISISLTPLEAERLEEVAKEKKLSISSLIINKFRLDKR